MSKSKDKVVCEGCGAVVGISELINNNHFCDSCSYELDAKLDNLTDEE